MKIYKKGIVKDYPYVYFGILFTVLLMFIYQLGGEIISSFFPDDKDFKYLPYINTFSQIAFILLPVIFFSNINPLGRKVILRLKFKLNSKELFIVLIGLLGFQFFSIGWNAIQQAIIPESYIDDYIKLVNKTEELYLMLLGGEGFFDGIKAIFVGAIIPAISEELLFRGLLQRSLEQSLKPSWAIVLSAFIFAIIHFIPSNFIPLFVIGLFLGIVAYITQSIYLPILLHFSNNAIAIISIFIIKPQQHSIEHHLTQEMIISAILFVFIGCSLLIFSIIKLISNKKQENKNTDSPNIVH